MLLDHPDYNEVVQPVWLQTYSINPLRQIPDRFKSTKHPLQHWNIHTVGHVQDQIQQPTYKIDIIQSQPTNSQILTIEASLQLQRENLLHSEEIF